MTVEVERDALLAALRQVGGVVESRVTIPVLANLLIDAREGALMSMGTNLDIQASARVEAAGELLTTVDARKFEAAVQSLRSGRLVIATVPGRSAITIKAGRSVRTIATLPATDFPKRPPLENATAFTLNSRAIMRLLDTCHVAQSNEETRYFLNGIFIHLVDGQMRAAATDGLKLVRNAISAPDELTSMPPVILPSKAVGHLRKALGKLDCDVAIQVTEAAIEFAFAGARILTKVVEATYPDYERIIPVPAASCLMVNRDALIEASAAVVAVVAAEGEIKSRVLRFELEEGEIQRLSARDTTGASSDEELEARHTGPGITFGINQAFLASMAAVFSEGAGLSMTIAAPNTPVLITSDKDPDLVAVIGSVRV